MIIENDSDDEKDLCGDLNEALAPNVERKPIYRVRRRSFVGSEVDAIRRQEDVMEAYALKKGYSVGQVFRDDGVE